MQRQRIRAETPDVPGTLHQGILWLLQDDPWLPFDLLGVERPVSGTPIPRRAEVERSGDRELVIHPYFPDLVLVYKDPDDPTRGVVISVEAQEKPVLAKRWRIPVCQALLADEYELPTWVVVLCLSKKTSAIVRAWGRGLPPRVDALVLDIDDIPRVGSIEQARRRPCAAVLSAALHGASGDLDAARIGIQVAQELPEKRRWRYTLTILAAVPKSIRSTLLKEMNMQEREIWDIERRSGLFSIAHEEGREEGRRATLIELISTVLELRGLSMDPAILERIRGCRELAMLERWATRAREVRATSELFDSD